MEIACRTHSAFPGGMPLMYRVAIDDAMTFVVSHRTKLAIPNRMMVVIG